MIKRCLIVTPETIGEALLLSPKPGRINYFQKKCNELFNPFLYSYTLGVFVEELQTIRKLAYIPPYAMEDIELNDIKSWVTLSASSEEIRWGGITTLYIDNKNRKVIADPVEIRNWRRGDTE